MIRLFTLTIFSLFVFYSHSIAQQHDAWIIEAESINPHEYYGETVANGMVGLVSSHEPMKIKDVVLNGVFDKYGRGRVENILKVFSHLNLELFVDNRLANFSTIQNYTQKLDIKHGIFITEFDFNGVHVKHRMRSLRHLPFNQLVELSITSSKNCNVRIVNKLKTPDHLRNNKMHFNEVIRPHAEIPMMTSVAESPTGRYEVAATTTFVFEDTHGHDTPRIIHEEWDEGMHYQHFSHDLKSGEQMNVALIGTTISSKQVQDPHNESERMNIFASLQGAEVLIEQHNQAWDQLWEGDIVIEGNAEDQQEVRNALYHLYSFVREGSGSSMSPMGLSGLGYNGHVFWDTEIWMYPPLLVFHPEIAKSLLDYRIDRLPAAKLNAYMHGYKGAMFPWESGDDGSEQTPVWALTGPFQHHISGDIAWAAWQYFLVTQDMDWLRDRGYGLLKEIADFWVSRVERNGPNMYQIKNVVAADEYAENVDDNAYTNALAILSLRHATQAAQLLGMEPNAEWKHVADNIPIHKNANGATLEHTTYNGEKIKQADVNLLSHPLYFITEKEQVRKDLEYYEPVYDEFGPAMGFCTLATIHAQLDNQSKAYTLWKDSFFPNKVPPFGVISETKGGTNPYFATGAGGMLQTVIWGFGGLRIQEDGIILSSQKLPSQWSSLQLQGVYMR